MPLKNHYQTLRLSSTATSDDIKKAYRRLAHQFHPDKNPDASGTLLFHEIQEAYSILSDNKKKRRYDEERYFSGLSSRKEPAAISSDWILKLTEELKRHTAYVHSYDLNHQALYDYVLLILSDVHVAVLQNERTEKDIAIIENILDATKKIDYAYYPKIITRLSKIAANNLELQAHLQQALVFKRRRNSSEKNLPWLVVTIVVLLCLAMYLYFRQRR